MVIAKAVVAAIGTVVTALTAALADDVLSMDDANGLLLAIVPAALSVWAVWKVENKPAPVQKGAHTS